MFVQNEWFSLPTHNYLLIHKTGCTYVRKIFETFYSNGEATVSSHPTNIQSNPCWTVIREPYERFISGLSYDIYKTGCSIDSALSDLPKLINQFPSPRFKPTSYVQHTTSQVSYLFNQPFSFFVKMGDLTEFCHLNFGLTLDSENKNEMPPEFKETIKTEIENRNLRQRVEDLLSYESCFYNTILDSDYIWHWQNGKVLGTGV